MDRLGPLRRHSYTIALVVMLVGLSPAQAEDEVLTLACQGTTAHGFKGAQDGKTRTDLYGHHWLVAH
jgi:hypothetical protein